MSTPVFTSVMWTPSYDKYGPLVTRRRGSGTVPRTAPGRRGSVDACARPMPSKGCAANQPGYPTEPERRARKTVRWLDDHKYPVEQPKTVSQRMPVPVIVRNSTSPSAKPELPPACQPFRIVDLPVYHPDDVRGELTRRLLKTINDLVPLGQKYLVLSTACVQIQDELVAITCELQDISVARLNFIADNIPDTLRRIRRLTSNIDSGALTVTQLEVQRFQDYANDARQIRKTRMYQF